MWILFRFLNAINRSLPLLVIAFMIGPVSFGEFTFHLIIAALFIMLANMGGTGRWHRIFISQKSEFHNQLVKINLLFNFCMHSVLALFFALIYLNLSNYEWYFCIAAFIFLKQSEIIIFILESERKIKTLFKLELAIFIICAIMLAVVLNAEIYVKSIYYIYLIPNLVLFSFSIYRFYQNKIQISKIHLRELVDKELRTKNTAFSIGSAVLALMLTRTEVMLGKYAVEADILGSLALSANIIGFLYNISTGSILRYLKDIAEGTSSFTAQTLSKIRFTFWVILMFSFSISLIIFWVVNIDTEYPFLMNIFAFQILVLPFHFLNAVWAKKYSLVTMMKINFWRNLYTVSLLGVIFQLLAIYVGTYYVGLALPLCYIFNLMGPDILYKQSRHIALQRLKVFL